MLKKKLLTLNIVLASSGSDTLWMRMAKLKVLVRKMGLSTGSTGLSLMWNRVAVWSKPRYLETVSINTLWASYKTAYMLVNWWRNLTLLKPQLGKGFQVLSSFSLLPSLLFFQKTGLIFLLLKLECKKKQDNKHHEHFCSYIYKQTVCFM